SEKDSLALLMAELEKDPKHVGNLIKLSRYYLVKGEYKKAFTLIEQGIILAPENGELYYCQGLAAGYLDLFEESEKYLKKARELGYKPR
ncbi:MAG: hypothetical protein KKE61_22525, partial [Proteobacteria bacterium]|nr:hypothetical protein [Pseudomonadota bacterium]